ncbi:peptide/nickel transport system substrate-binding protein [Anaerosolibacter carboniphilus]|uniref:Peptide/nickel transport system substrate-binding protein n=1 Tax=Anaerosolibacter carboniphilus TaxID=1417629 RepID=A0A841KNA9_9FIRM|nr:peptide ABC transporter substrate-binding protein [Anaerosolibacter carboniphilus]MBB6214927.1 peptide/nickel transport system substrate-binding protein [Anaerosolibacter carboniphilus]
MINKKTNIFIILLLLLSFTVFGCSKPVKDGENPEQPVEEVKKPLAGGELVLPITQFDTLNPILNKNESIFYFNQLVYDGLVFLDSKLEAQPALATGWTATENGDGWTFQLRENVSWHDGQPFTAEDVKFTIDALRTSNGNVEKSIFSGFVKNIKNITVLGSHKIFIETNSAIGNQIENFQFPIIPKHKYGSPEDVFKSPKDLLVGTGRYKVEAYTKPNYVRLKSNDKYWDTSAFVPTVIGKIVPDPETALSSVEANEASVGKATDFDWEKYGEDKTLKTYAYTDWDYEFIGFNFNRAITADKSIRTAIAYGIDRHQIVNDVYFGHATITDTPIHPDSWLNDASAQKYGKEQERAKKLLADANWRDENKDGILENELNQKLSLTLLVNNDNPRRVEVADMVVTQLKEIGIEVIAEKVNWEEYQYRLNSGGFDMVLGGWKMSVNPDISFIFHSSYMGNSNFIGYSNPQLDQQLMEAALAKSAEDRKQKYRDVQNTILEEIPYYSLFFENNALVVKDYVKGNIDPKPYNIYNNIEQWYVLEEKE